MGRLAATDALAAVDYRPPDGITRKELDHLATAAAASPACRGVSIVIHSPDLDPDRVEAPKVVDSWSG